MRLGFGHGDRIGRLPQQAQASGCGGRFDGTVWRTRRRLPPLPTTVCAARSAGTANTVIVGHVFAAYSATSSWVVEIKPATKATRAAGDDNAVVATWRWSGLFTGASRSLGCIDL